jgi:N-acetylglucosaminyldiphosphoundecaprenol N-acetyl-beta-D-mannosaminyltransferase
MTNGFAAQWSEGELCVVGATPSRPRLDLGRKVHALFGLVFDAVTRDEAIGLLRHAGHSKQRCLLSTPNLNFVVSAQADRSFADSVLVSDLVVADGMPIVWAARWMGIPIPERVAGSDLFSSLAGTTALPESQRLKVFFFGGPDGVAERAYKALNARADSGLRCVGYESPGFGSLEDLSDSARIERINAVSPDFVVVALGARRGQAWILSNIDRLAAPIVSHLGAVVNFVAGTVKRSPHAINVFGLEWLWRIGQEPNLWRRYLNDGFAAARLVARQILLWPLLRAWHQRTHNSAPPPVLSLRRDAKTSTLSLAGVWGAPVLGPLRHALASELNAGQVIRIDLAACRWVDSACIGLLLLVDAWQDTPSQLLVPSSATSAVRSSILAHGATRLLEQR